MKKKSLIIFIIVLSNILFFSCNDQNNNKDKSGFDPIIIEFESIVGKIIPLNLSSIVQDIKYIALETKKECLIGEVYGIRIFGENIIVVSNNKVLLFDNTGRFISVIGTIGKGPGEYIRPMDIQINEPDNSIIIMDSPSKQILEYSINGDFIKRIPLPKRENVWQILYFENTYIILNKIAPRTKVQLYRINSNGDIAYEYPIMSELKGSNIIGTDYAGFNLGFGYFDFTTSWNDTIFRIFSDNNINPLYLLYYGKYKYPIEQDNGSSPRIQIVNKKYIYPLWKVITNDYLFIQYQYQLETWLAIYDKNENKMIFNNIIDDDLSSGVSNDIDGGIGIRRVNQYKFNNGYDLVKSISSFDILNISIDDSINEKKINIDRMNSTFFELAKTIKENDNPVIQVINLNQTKRNYK